MNNFLIKSLIMLMVIIFFSTIITAQEEIDPLKDSRDLVQSNEIILIWSEAPVTNQPSTISQFQKVYDYFNPADDINFFPLDERIVPKPKHEYSGDSGVFGNRHMDVKVGDFNGDGLKEYVSAWEGPGAKINISIPSIDKNTLELSESFQITTDSLLIDQGGSSVNRFIHLTTGDFDGDLQDEFVLAFQGFDETIHLQLYDTDGGLMPELKAEINDESLPRLPFNLARIGVAAADFDNDDKAEIILTSQDPEGTEDKWTVYAKIYDVESGAGYSIIPKAKTNLFTEPVFSGFEAGPINLGVTAGTFNRDFKKDAAVVVSIFQRDEPGDDTFLYLLNIGGDLNSIDFGDTTTFSQNLVGPNEMEPLTIKSGDLNGDKIDEIVYSSGSRIFVFSSNENLKPVLKTQSNIGSVDDQYTYNYMDLGDLDLDGNAEIVTVFNLFPSGPGTEQTLEISAYEVDEGLKNISLKGERNFEEPQSSNGSFGLHRHYAIAVGDFDGDRVRLGKPKRYFESEISQPLVILNSPPVHYDILDEMVFDINGCFGTGPCGFSATYVKSITASGEMSTTVTSDWGMDTSITGDVNIYGNGVKRSLDSSYSEGFAYNKSKQETFRINFTANAVSEDLIFGTVTDYVLWEYPIISDDTIRGHIVVVEPKKPIKSWFSTESWPGFSYIPNHEVGNILSYSEYNNLTANDYLSEQIKLDNGVRFGLSPSSTFSWEVDFSSWSGSSTSRSVKIGSRTGFAWSAGIDIDFYGSVKSTYGEEMNSTYEEEEVSTHTSTVEEAFEIKVELGNITDGEKRYDVTPYAYWAKNGALVLDYAARPQLAPPGQPETWWQQNYGKKPDPAFILPFRYHAEKGLSQSGDEKKFLTRDIAFFPDNVEPGERVTIAARIGNFSLLDTEAPIKVRFYVGDPDNGGTPIVGTQSETTLTTDNFIPFRGSTIVSLDWNVPVDIAAFPRIYAVIDPDNEVTEEIHEDNNKGYNVLGTDFLTAIENNESLIKNAYQLEQNYPNPFNPATVIKYTLPINGLVTLKIYDVLGREVQTLVNQAMDAGQHEISFDASGLVSGVYFYSLHAQPSIKGGNSFVQTKKMLLLK